MIIYKSKCPNCSAANCYNSGFSVECVNNKCNFYSDSHCKFIQQEIKKKFDSTETKIKESTESNQIKQLDLYNDDQCEIEDYVASSYYPWANYNNTINPNKK